ncbi:MAG: diaminopimelate decarboxylase [Verrucomicrobia bacterium]|nr:diaminopimelate decarboxylase [Verrucomicrobiota bacterium]
MHSFHYQNNELACESVRLQDLAESYGTPLYVYSSQTVTDHFRRLDHALGDLDHEICYAVKANSNLAILRLLAAQGSGFDIVSGGELYRVIQAGGEPGKCTFAGVGKTEDEIAYALHSGIYSFNVESEAELRTINDVARSMDRRAPIALRVNPDVDPHTHHYISTGKSENKFGIAIDRIMEAYELAASLPNLDIRGLQMHIGSQITEPEPFAEAIAKVLPLAEDLRRRFRLEFMSIGGGIGIVYRGSLESGDAVWWQEDGARDALTIEQYVQAISPSLRRLKLRVLLEPGRFLVGNAGVLLTRVLYIKRAQQKTFVIVDAGMNDLIRPALYSGYHEIVPVRRRSDAGMEVVDVVGPVCESGDFFAQDREVARTVEGDLLALMSAGAYGFSMASTYNSRPLPAEVLVAGAGHRLIRRRQNYADLIAAELEAEEVEA